MRKVIWRRPTRPAFTLVELLVVIAIIGVLVALLLPAVQAAREAARRTQCVNHLKQIGLGFQLHHDTHSAFPSGGRGSRMARTMENGYPALMARQAWVWTYQIMPYIEQQALYNEPVDQNVMEKPVKIYFCPSRRPPQVWDCYQNDSYTGTPLRRAQIDYAGNRGSVKDGSDGVLPQGYDPAATPPKVIPEAVRIPEITDGASNTMMVAERPWGVNWYLSQPHSAESDVHNGGYVTNYPYLNVAGTFAPFRDLKVPSASDDLEGSRAVQKILREGFGSAHPGGMNALVCDGSVRLVSYNITATLMLNFCRRYDGNAFSVGDLGG